jgi:hypothetical protein
VTSLSTNLPELEAALPVVRARLADALERRARVAAIAAAAQSTFTRRAADARALLQGLEHAAAELAEAGEAAGAQLSDAVTALAADLADHLAVVAAVEAELAGRLDALEGGGDALLDELALLLPSTAAAGHAAERASEEVGTVLMAEASELRMLAEEAATAAESVAAVAEAKQVELAAEWDEVRSALQATLSTRQASLDGAIPFVREAMEVHDVELESVTIEAVEDAGQALMEQIAHRLSTEVADPLSAAMQAAAASLDEAAGADDEVAAALGGARAELADAISVLRALLPASCAQVDAARVAAAQVDVDWR